MPKTRQENPLLYEVNVGAALALAMRVGTTGVVEAKDSFTGPSELQVVPLPPSRCAP